MCFIDNTQMSVLCEQCQMCFISNTQIPNSNHSSDEHLIADCYNICAATKKHLHHFGTALCASIHERSCTLHEEVAKGFVINLLKTLHLSESFVAPLSHHNLSKSNIGICLTSSIA